MKPDCSSRCRTKINSRQRNRGTNERNSMTDIRILQYNVNHRKKTTQILLLKNSQVKQFNVLVIQEF